MTSPTLRSWNLRELDTALEAFGDFAHVVLEAPQALEFAVKTTAESRITRTLALRVILPSLT